MWFDLAVVVAATLSTPCSVMPSVFGPSRGESIVLARHTGATRLVQAPMAPDYFPVELYEVAAYEFDVVSATTVEGLGLAWGVVAPGDRVWLVPWQLDSSCTLVPRGGNGWVPTDSLAVFRASAARRHEGVPVIDAVTPPSGYPHVDGRDVVPNGVGRFGEEWLSAADFYRILSSAPRLDGTRSRAEELQRVENAYRSGPTALLSTFPGPELLDFYREWAAADPGSVRVRSRE